MISHRLLCLFLLGLLPLAAAGCNIVGAAAQLLPPEVKPPSYVGLQEQDVAVMVWTEQRTRMDFPTVGLDLAAAVQGRLNANKEKQKVLKGLRFPYEARSIVRFQRDHPEIDAIPVAQVAPRLAGISRLIYVELEQFGTRSDAAPDLYRGNAVASIKVVEIRDGKGTIAFEESGISVVFPDRVPPEGMPGGSDDLVYRGTLDRLSTAVLHRFIPHEVER